MKEKLFSVLMSVYYNDNPKYLRAAVESVSIKQTLQPKELILVVDGPVPELVKSEIKALCGEIPYIKTLWKPLNEGLGKALRDGVLIATYHIIARMDSDDISSPTRFEQQIKCMEQDDNIDIVGGSISEFIDTPDNIVGYRTVPDSDAEIKDYMKSRCALKESVLKVGNYQDWYWNEDYYLWIRMQLNGCKFANITENLVNVRVGKDMYA